MMDQQPTNYQESQRAAGYLSSHHSERKEEQGHRLDIEWAEEQQETPILITERQLHNGRPYLR